VVFAPDSLSIFDLSYCTLQKVIKFDHTGAEAREIVNVRAHMSKTITSAQKYDPPVPSFYS
jgi:hypothetical protein